MAANTPSQEPRGTDRRRTGKRRDHTAEKVARGVVWGVQNHIENREEVGVPQDMMGRPGERFVLRVRGDSMIEEQICDGDLVVVEHRETARNGDGQRRNRETGPRPWKAGV